MKREDLKEPLIDGDTAGKGFDSDPEIKPSEEKPKDELWDGLARAYDTVGSMIVAITWCYLVPLAALPTDG